MSALSSGHEFSGVESVHQATPPHQPPRRILFIDNIRWSLIALVIAHHAAVTYSHVGGWYYFAGPKPGPIATALFASFLSINQAYFMGLLFLLAGYFVPKAYDVKGFKRFLRDRALRLGIPSLFYMLVIAPFIECGLLRTFLEPRRPSFSEAYLPYLLNGKFLLSFGPMWFAVALFFFCCLYALSRLALPKPSASLPIPGNMAVTTLILVMGACTFLVRIAQPIGISFLNMQLCYFSQYILLFCVGILANRSNWLQTIPYSFGKRWFLVSLAIGIPALFDIVFYAIRNGATKNLLGGFHLQSALFSFWEAFFSVGVCLGLIVLFREHANSQGRLTAWLSRNSFSAYLFHPPILIAITLSLRPLTAGPGVKFALAAALSIPITFALAGFIRERVPGLRRLL